MSETYTIVTALFDLRTKENNSKTKDTKDPGFVPPDKYFDSCKPFFEKPFPLIIYTEAKYVEKMYEMRPIELHSFTRVIVKEYEDLNNYSLFNKFETAHNSHKIHNLDQNKFTALYKFIVNQKTEFVKDAIMMNPFSTEKFAWMDMRLHVVYDMSIEETNQVFENIPTNKILMMQQSYPSKPHEVKDRRDHYCVTRGKVCAGIFIGYKDALLKFCRLCRKEFENAVLNWNIAPSDEMVFSTVISENHDFFEPKVGDYGEVLKNLSYPRGSIHLITLYMGHSSNNGKKYYKYKLAKDLYETYNKKEHVFSNEEIHQIYSYIISGTEDEVEKQKFIEDYKKLN
jgi:hypothetical protein